MRLSPSLQQEQFSINQPIKMRERKQEIAKLHDQKNPGTNKIVNDFLKCGGPAFKGKIKGSFSKIFKSESIHNQ